jgi:hypothetical protein
LFGPNKIVKSADVPKDAGVKNEAVASGTAKTDLGEAPMERGDAVPALADSQDFRAPIQWA